MDNEKLYALSQAGVRSSPFFPTKEAAERYRSVLLSGGQIPSVDFAAIVEWEVIPAGGEAPAVLVTGVADPAPAAVIKKTRKAKTPPANDNPAPEADAPPAAAAPTE